MWNDLDDKSQEEYGRDYLFDGIDKGVKDVMDIGKTDINYVVHAVENGLFKINPCSSYIVSGSSRSFDDFTVSIV